jgi:hypothetical protein
MQKFSELKYSSPDYDKEKAVLLKAKEDMTAASSYKIFRDLWLSRKNADEYLDMLIDFAHIRYLTNTSDPFYKHAVQIDFTEEPQINLLRQACDDVILDSPYLEDIKAEFGDKIIQDLSVRRSLSGEKAVPLQREELQLRMAYNNLVPQGEQRKRCPSSSMIYMTA